VAAHHSQPEPPPSPLQPVGSAIAAAASAEPPAASRRLIALRTRHLVAIMFVAGVALGVASAKPRSDLRRHDVSRERMSAADSLSVLRGQGGDDGRTVEAGRGEHLQVDLRDGEGREVRAGEGERDEIHHSPARWCLALSVAAVQAGGLGMVAVGLTLMEATRVSPTHPAAGGSVALWLCIVGLLGVFAVGYPGYFVFDAIWPSYYYSPIANGKNTWLLGQAFFIAVLIRYRRNPGLDRQLPLWPRHVLCRSDRPGGIPIEEQRIAPDPRPPQWIAGGLVARPVEHVLNRVVKPAHRLLHRRPRRMLRSKGAKPSWRYPLTSLVSG